MAIDMVIKPSVGKEVIGREVPHGVELINISQSNTRNPEICISTQTHTNQHSQYKTDLQRVRDGKVYGASAWFSADCSTQNTCRTCSMQNIENQSVVQRVGYLSRSFKIVAKRFFW